MIDPLDSDAGERFFTLSIDMLCFAGFDGYFRRLNSAWERALGYTRDELMAMPMWAFVHPDDVARSREQNRIVREGGEARLFENRYRHKDGTYRWFRWNAKADLDRQLIYAVARDVTEEKAAHAEREGLLADLQQALSEVRTLQRILPICSYCQKIRDDENYWHSVEAYLAAHTSASFSHGICPNCFATEVEPHLRRE